MSGLMGVLKYFGHLGDLTEQEGGNVPPPVLSYLLLESGGHIILENGSGFLALEH